MATTNTDTTHNPGEESPQAALLEVARRLRGLLEYQRATGVRSLAKGGRAAAPRATVVAEPAPARLSPEAAPAGPPGAERPSAATGLEAAATLEELRAHIGDCRACKLAGGRRNLVFGVGNPNAELMFAGEGPGHDEDVQGEPFVGRAGQLLTEIITKGMKIRREDVYIANVVKCRPPGNRNPEADEIASCMPFLQRQIGIVRPKVIVALGTFAAQTLLGVRTPIMRLRGEWHEYAGIRLMPTLHPAYLLRNPADKRLVWEDIKKVMAELGLPL